MKNIFAIILSLSLFLNPITVFAEGKKKTSAEASAEFDPRVQSAIYDLDHIKDVLLELDYVREETAADAYTKKVVQELHDRFAKATGLLSAILIDTSLDEEKKADYLRELTPRIGSAWKKVFRFQKEDTKDDPRQPFYRHLPEVQRLANKILQQRRSIRNWKDKITALEHNQKIKPGFTTDEREKLLLGLQSAEYDLDDTQDEMIDVLDEQEMNKAPTIYQIGNPLVRIIRAAFDSTTFVATQIAKEAFYMDMKAIFTRSMTTRGEKVWTLLSRSYRNSASQDAVRSIAKMALDTFAKIENQDDALLNKQRNYWISEIGKMIRLRGERLGAQRALVATYVGLFVWAMAAPHFDVVGYMDGGWSQHSLFVSSQIYAWCIWAPIGFLKFASYSGHTVAMLKTLRDIMYNEKPVAESDLKTLKKPSLFDRLMKVFPKKKNCETILTENKTTEDSK